MQRWNQFFLKNTGLSPYIWLVFGILPFYFIFRSSLYYEIAFGILMIFTFFFCYFLTFVSKGWVVYVGMSMQIAISIAMTLWFGYLYFAFFLAFYIGNIRNRAGFITLYTVHLATTFITINIGFALQKDIFVTQSPFILISLIGVILLPINSYNRNKQGELQEKLKDANKRIDDLIKLEERQRIARDLHDTLGQKLSLIGLKSDLAGRLIHKDPQQARLEINDVHQTARTALKEVRQIVSRMRGTRLDEEMFRIKQILKAARIELVMDESVKKLNISRLSENVLSMCLKEAVTNVVKHSRATQCEVTIKQTNTEVIMKVQDNGSGIMKETNIMNSHGLQGMKERLEFVNGSLEIQTGAGTTVIAKIPNIVDKPDIEVEK